MRKIIVIALCVSLAACGGGDSEQETVNDLEVPQTTTGTGGSTSGGSTTSETIKITSLNRVQHAKVCADINGDLSCQSDEVIGKTDEEGFFELESKYQENTIIISIKPNDGYDLQLNKGSDTEFDIYAHSPITYISPLTRLSIDTSLSHSELAEMWGLEEAKLFGDYVQGIIMSDPSQSHIAYALSNFIRQQLISATYHTGLPELIAVAMDDVHAAVEAGRDLSNLLFTVEYTGKVITNLEKPLIEYIDTAMLEGEWNSYKFGGNNDDTYAKVSIDPSQFTRQYNVYEAKLNSDTPINTSGHPDGTTLSTNIGVLNIGLDHVLQLVYGNKTSRGTVLIFKAQEYIGINLVDNGFVWMDNFEAPVTAGSSYVEFMWPEQSFYTIGANNIDSIDSYVLSTDAQSMVTAKYSNGTEIQEQATFNVNHKLLNGVTLNGATLEYIDNNDSSEYMYGMYRMGDYMSLGFSNNKYKSGFTLLSPNKELIDKVYSGTLVQGTTESYSKF